MNKYHYEWTKEQEAKAIEMYRHSRMPSEIARVLHIPYSVLVSLLQRKMVIACRMPDPALVAQMAKMYTLDEISEQLNMSKEGLRNFAKAHCIYLAKTTAQLPRVHPMATKESRRTFATLANAVAQANAEKYAIVSKHTYMSNQIYNGVRCTMVEFSVVNERHERLWDGEPVRLMQNDIYVKTPEGGTFCATKDEIKKLSNVVNNNVTIISDNYE